MKAKFAIPLIVLSLVISITGIVLLSLWNSIMNGLIQNFVVLKNGSELYEMWKTPSLPIYMQFYIFNITNPEQFLNGSKPRVAQMGPYTYLEKRSVENITFNNGTVAYNEVIRYIYQPLLSAGSENDSVTTINLFYTYVSQHFDMMSKFMIDLFVTVEKAQGYPFITKQSVFSFLWGREDKMLNFLKHIITVPMSKIGVFVDKNGTDTGRMEIDTGLFDRARLGKVLHFRGENESSCWRNWEANQFNGTDGSIYRPFLKIDDYVDVFGPDICRSLRFTVREELTIQDVPVYKYLALESSFAPPESNPQGDGFCPRLPVCLGNGLLDLTTCISGMPFAASLPHFFGVNQSYVEAVEGLHPSPEFNTTLFINPQTGILLQAAKKFQINVNITQNSEFSEMSKIQSVFLPLFYINESVQLDSSTTKELHQRVVVLPLAAKVVVRLLVCASLITVVGLCVVLMRQWMRSKRPETEAPLLTAPVAT